MPAVSPAQQTLPVSFSIKINDAIIADTYQILCIDIVHESGKASMAGIKIMCGDLTEESFAPADDAVFTIGNSISVSAGYDNALTEIFLGTIEKLALNISPNDQTNFTLICTNPAETAQTQPDAPVLTIAYGRDIFAFNAEAGRQTTTSGSATFQGSALAKPGENIELANPSNRFGGVWTIRRANHHISDGNWVTTVGIDKAE